MKQNQSLSDHSAEHNTSSFIKDSESIKKLEDGFRVSHCDFCGNGLTCSKESSLLKNTEAVFKALKLARVRGLVCIAGCVNSDCRGSYAELAEELIKRDLLVTVSGCAAVELEKGGLMSDNSFNLTNDVMEEFCDYFGIFPAVHIGSYGSDADISDFYAELAGLTETGTADLPAAVIIPSDIHDDSTALRSALDRMHDIHGTVFNMGDDASESADMLEKHIHEKRLGLGWCDRFASDLYS